MTNRENNPENKGVEPFFSKDKTIKDLVTASAVGIFIGFLSPFGMDQLPRVISISFWVFTCLVGYFIYSPIIHFGSYLLKNKLGKYSLTTQWHGVAIMTIFGSILMSFAVPIISWLFFGISINYYQQFFTILPQALVIGGVISFISMVRGHIAEQQAQLNEKKEIIEKQQQVSDAVYDKQLQKFMNQLPVDKRGTLHCLEMSDHYLKVYTDKGHHLVLMRFKDALAALADYPGIQTHRSWWVALESVESYNKEGRKVFLTLKNNLDVPVSRTFLDAVKEANIH
ncbi:LytTR family DNA-binding domain-containing protein [Thalassotalea atypica]|uniref:LytTR family DNA-binding domain-containing protein n=1 Tax=Thalassotalea atypica TaxID=2054316 RepID=UPI0025739FB1|nr:LytTR family DNA-binding domain-containing protein [Thalassotalea atypica]